MDEFFRGLQELIGSGHTRSTLRYLYRVIDDWLIDGEGDLVDAVLGQVDSDAYSFVILVGFMTVTLESKNRLPSRAALFVRIRARARDELGVHRAERLLFGLE